MANYSLVINSRFRPFEYQELLAPVLMATQAHQAVEEAYADLSTKASIWDKMANEATDPKAHAMYKKYADDLQSYSDQLAQYGLTPTSRQAMLNMRSRYAKEIVPIETAYKRREADIAAQKEIMLKDPTHLFNRRASEVSLDEYLDNQNLDVLSDNYSRELLTQQVSQAAANLKQTLMKKGALTALGLPYQYERMIQYGASADDVLAAMSKDSKAMPILTKLVEDVMAASGIRNWSSMNGDWANNPTYQAAEVAAMRGLYSAIGTSKIDHFTDQAGLTQLQYDLQDRNNRRVEDRAAARKAQEERQKQAQGIALSGESYIVTSGQDRQYLANLQGLRAGTNGVKASIFGKTGKVNALTVYDEYRRAGANTLTSAQRSQADRVAEERAMKKFRDNWGTNIPPKQRGAAAQWLDRVRASERSAEYTAAARRAVLQKHGVSQVLTQDQYNTLKAIGYNGEQVMSMNQFSTRINNLSTQRTYYSTNMSNYTIPDQKIRNNLANWNTNGSFSGRVYKLTSNGSRGSAVKFKDLNLKSDTNKEGREITGVYYSDVTPDKIIIQVGSGTGERYLVDPNALGTNVNSFIVASRDQLKGVSSTERAQTITIGLANMLNSYNPTLSTTSSNP